MFEHITWQLLSNKYCLFLGENALLHLAVIRLYIAYFLLLGYCIFYS